MRCFPRSRVRSGTESGLRLVTCTAEHILHKAGPDADGRGIIEDSMTPTNPSAPEVYFSSRNCGDGDTTD